MRKMIKKKASLHRLMDTDKNNMVTFGEFQRGVAMSGIRPMPREEQMMELFAAFDVNEDLRISYEEMMEKIEAEERRARAEAATFRPRPIVRPPPAAPSVHALQVRTTQP